MKNISHSLIVGDPQFTYWTMSWDVHSFLHNPANIFNANIYYPYKNTLAYSEGLFVPAVFALPLFLVFRNMIVAFNLMIFFSYILAAWGGYKLAKYYTKNDYASFLAGLIFGFSTFRIVSMGHFQNLMIFWIPFAALYLQKYLDTWNRKNILIFALFFSAQMLSCWNMGAYLALFVVFLLAANYRTIHNNISSFMKDGVIALAIIIILVSPFAYPYFKLHQETHFSYQLWEITKFSADIGGYIFPAPGTFESRFTSFFGINKQHWAENTNFLGIFSILLLTYYFLFHKNKIISKNFRIYAWGIPIFIIFSFGPILRFIPGASIPSIYYLILPVTGFIRTPSRISIIVLLCVSIAVAYIISLAKIKNRWLKLLLTALASIFILFESWVPHSPLLAQTACPGIYSYLKNNNSITGMVEFPGLLDLRQTIDYVYYSTCDDFKPIFNGYSGSAPPDYGSNSEILKTFPSFGSVQLMKQMNISHAILHLDKFPENERRSFLEAVKQNDNLQIEYQEQQDYLIAIKRD